jgi:hypothetical protein
MNRGVPPTDRNARTGELTPPGVTVVARSNSSRDRGAGSAFEFEVRFAGVSAVTVPV